MPNPLCENDAAAQFLDFYGSAAMEKDIVNRLYDKGVQRQKLARQQAVANATPIRPVVTRTPEEIEKFVRRAVDKEQALRQRRLIELEQQRRLELNPREPQIKKSFDSKTEEKKHLQHMYDHQLKRFGITGRNEALYGEEDGVKALERQWKAVCHSPPRADGKQLLVHGKPSCKSERPHLRSKSALVGEGRENYYARLSRPVHKFEKYLTESNVNTFSVYSKFRAQQKADMQ